MDKFAKEEKKNNFQSRSAQVKLNEEIIDANGLKVVMEYFLHGFYFILQIRFLCRFREQSMAFSRIKTGKIMYWHENKDKIETHSVNYHRWKQDGFVVWMKNAKSCIKRNKLKIEFFIIPFFCLILLVHFKFDQVSRNNNINSNVSEDERRRKKINWIPFFFFIISMVEDLLLLLFFSFVGFFCLISPFCKV